MTICANCGCPVFGVPHVNPKTGGKWCDDCYRALPSQGTPDGVPPQAKPETAGSV